MTAAPPAASHRPVATTAAHRWRPGLRALVLGVCGVLVIATAVVVSDTVSDHLRSVAANEATRSTEAVIRGYIDPEVAQGALDDPTGPSGVRLDAQLERLVAAGQILRIKIWDRDGKVVFSDLPALRGRQFELEDDLLEVFEGNTETEFSSGEHAENEFERGLAARLLSIYLPIRGAGGEIAGAYEIYEDAAPIEVAIDRAHQDVLVIVGAMAAILLLVLFLAFSVTSRQLTRQNQQLREQALTEQALVTDLRASQERFRSLVQNSVDVSLIVRPDGVVEYQSPAVERVLGHPAELLVGKDARAAVHPEDLGWAEQLLAEVGRTPGALVTGEFRLAHADGSWRTVEAVGKNLADDPAVRGIVINYRDVTIRKALEDELRHQAFHDSLTGLANRALFIDRLEHALARARLGSPQLAVLFVDLDDFKNVNDSLGHADGDRLLVAVALRLRAALRAGDTIARMGGDEFAILLEDPADTSSPVEVAERLRVALQAPFDEVGRGLTIRGSVGIARSASRHQSADELLRDADVAMYAAKANGKDRIEVFEPSMHAAALDRMALTVDLEGALERGEFFLLYQPVIELASGRMVGAEALLRWQHPSRGIVAPLDFIPAAEASGLIVPIGQWVLETACAQLARWDEAVSAGPAPPHLAINVNVAARQVAERAFVDDVARVLETYAIEPSRLVLEFTESALMRETDVTMATLHRLKDLGVTLAIDDFGTGYSSLSYLRQFPVDVLKIDRSFVANLSKGPGERALMDSILRLSETLNLQTVAEGIEDDAQLDDLRRLGAALGQGYLFARPIEADAIAALLGGTSGHGGDTGESATRDVA